ncbi:P-selectin isoform X3 [Hemicordylus capensis]|uniref:P-selectin isoform X3 n=1 Tax=Hemicordylus capensis TaxID=884348 RepID=UPI0023033551|nr:P-selectin isoform X3 [Hemicordylus capensis]
MGVISGRSLYRWTIDCILFFTITSCGLWLHVDTWTYHAGQSDLSWEKAREFCKTYYTDLVAIQNKEEIAHLNANFNFVPSYYWIGIRKINNVWTWVGTNKTLTKEAENWAKKEPNNRRSDEDCVEIYIKRPIESGKWNDERCSRKKRALCYQASCQSFSCSQRGDCVETIGNYTCQCYPGFFGPECEYVVKCRDLDAVQRPLLMNCSHPLENFSYSSQCVFSCDEEGFEMSGRDSLQCLSSGNWSAEMPQCVVKQCQEIASPTSGTMDCINPIAAFGYNSTCNFACEAGFQLSGSKTLHCNISGQWTAHVPICHAMQCHTLQSPNKGRMNCSHLYEEFAYQSTCEFACEPGFVLAGTNATHCLASGNWSAPLPTCQVIECPKLDAPENGGLNCSHPHGDFAYSSSCTFSCDTGFVRAGKEKLQCMALGMWTEKPPSCEAMQCHTLQSPNQGRMNCSHPFEEFAYQSTCEFACEPGFVLAGTNATHCLASGNWSAPLPTCQVIECPKLDAPENGGLNCSHPHGDFAYSSSCTFSCNTGFVRAGKEKLQCMALGMWTEKPPSCEAVKCSRLHKPDNGYVTCSHPRGEFAYGSSCDFFCNPGFQLEGLKTLECMALGNWTEQPAYCKAVQCPTLETPDNGKENCSHPHGHFAYNSSCIFSCNSGFELAGSEKIVCTDQGNWTEDIPICEATKCPVLDTLMNGWLNCSHPLGNFTYNSSCIFFCDMGFVRVGSELRNCMALGEWTGTAPSCEAMKCPQLGVLEHMEMNCSHPWSLFSYQSACHFHCAEGFILNGTSRMQCQPDGRWSAELPVCQENVAVVLKQSLLYTGGVAASVVALVLSGALIAMAIRRFTKREKRKRLLNSDSDLGTTGVFSNAGFDS